MPRDIISAATLNRRMLADALRDVPDALATFRPSGEANHIAFLALHVLDARTHATNLMAGEEVRHAFSEVVAGARGLQDIDPYPPLGEVLAAWHGVSDRFEERLEEQDSASLSTDLGEAYPNGRSDLGGALSFLMTHEAYHIGQVNLVRRLAGLKPVGFFT